MKPRSCSIERVYRYGHVINQVFFIIWSKYNSYNINSSALYVLSFLKQMKTKLKKHQRLYKDAWTINKKNVKKINVAQLKGKYERFDYNNDTIRIHHISNPSLQRLIKEGVVQWYSIFGSHRWTSYNLLYRFPVGTTNTEIKGYIL